MINGTRIMSWHLAEDGPHRRAAVLLFSKHSFTNDQLLLIYYSVVVEQYKSEYKII